MTQRRIEYPKDVAAEFFKKEGRTPREGLTQEILTQLVETMLFASMATEEGQLTPVGIVFAERIDEFAKKPGWELVEFVSKEDFEVKQLAKLASACGSPGSLLAVVPKDKEPVVAGIVTPRPGKFWDWSGNPDRWVRILVLQPGVISVGCGEEELIRYSRGEILHVPRRLAMSGGGEYPAQLEAIEQTVFQDPNHRTVIEAGEYLQRIVEGMIRLRHGGILAVLGPDEEPGELLDGSKKFVEPLRFGKAIKEMYEAGSGVAARNSDQCLVSEVEPAEADARSKTNEVNRLIDQIARFTTVDGAVVMNHALDVLAFGAKIQPKDKEKHLRAFGVVDGRPTDKQWPLEMRGTRHRAAAVFAGQHEKGLAFIVSQDGHAAVFLQLDKKVVYWPLAI